MVGWGETLRVVELVVVAIVADVPNQESIVEFQHLEISALIRPLLNDSFVCVGKTDVRVVEQLVLGVDDVLKELVFAREVRVHAIRVG